MLLLDLTHTSNCTARTGIQRVALALEKHLPAQAHTLSICYDKMLRQWRPLRSSELARLHLPPAPGASRKARPPLLEKIQTQLSRLRKSTAWKPPADAALIAPELFSSTVAARYPAIFSEIHGPKVAVFHDAIALLHPEVSPPKTVERFPAFLQELTQFSAIAATSETSHTQLLDFWKWAGLSKTPPVFTIPLGVEKITHTPAHSSQEKTTPARVLCIGSIEGRKNHLALLHAAETLWVSGHAFELHLVGLPQKETGAAALEKIDQLVAAQRPLFFHGHIGDAALETLWATARFTVYPSEHEGFGLPVAESLAREIPCICSAKNGPGELARGGGCIALENANAENLANSIRQLLTDEAMLGALKAKAQKRVVRSWADYASDLAALVKSLR